ncbi:hypothetical protein FRC03_012157 [Tulasnella sp. 419]|nr:hypothetical protein FRC02_003142 [Tulasnella sp. 418]KAG8952404.1 hypothetical protein FRC03_012157 [Tulasnella sp. 419]
MDAQSANRLVLEGQIFYQPPPDTPRMKPATSGAPSSTSSAVVQASRLSTTTGDPQAHSQSQYGQLHMHAGLGIPQPWTVETLLQTGAAAAAYPPVPAQQQMHMLTIYMQDYRNGLDTPDHLLSELSIPLQKDSNDQYWVNADEMVRRLQLTPGRIDGSAKLFIKRGVYKQIFCRISGSVIEKCMPENLRITSELSIEIVIEINNPAGVPSPRHSSSSIVSTKRPNPETEESSAGPHSKRSRHTPDPTTQTSQSIQPNITTPLSANFDVTAGMFDSHSQNYLSIQPTPPALPVIASSSKDASPEKSPPASKGKTFSSGGKTVNIKNETARAAIIPWLREQMKKEEGYDSFVKSKGRILTVGEALKGYRFARAMIQKYNNMQTPPDLDGAANRKVTKVNVWQALDRQTSWGSDAETTLALVEKYGPGGPHENEKIVQMINGKFGPDEREGTVLFLQHLKRIDIETKASQLP